MTKNVTVQLHLFSCLWKVILNEILNKKKNKEKKIDMIYPSEGRGLGNHKGPDRIFFAREGPAGRRVYQSGVRRFVY